MRKYEYAIMSRNFAAPSGEDDLAALNQMGAEGWELVSAVAAANHLGGTSRVTLYLKREVRP